MLYSILLLVAVLSMSCASSDNIQSDQPRKYNVTGIVNYTELVSNKGFAGALVGFGGATSKESMSWLQSRGFTTVINLRAANEEGVDLEGSQKAAEAAGITYLHMPFDPGASEPDVVPDILSVLSDSQRQPVYIHCNSATRVAAIWMVGRVMEDGWDADAAGEECALLTSKPDGAKAFATQYLAQHDK